MASANSICKRILNVKGVVVESTQFYTDSDQITHLMISARPDKWHQCLCPLCNKKCPKDGPSVQGRVWRGLDFGSTVFEIIGDTQRINCPEHGRIVASVPWAYPGSKFTRNFDLTAGWLAVYLPKSVVAEYMRIDWDTVGRCISRTLHEIEPDRKKRLDNLVNIAIDETSYKKGHKYITVILNHDTNTVVWASVGYGKAVLEKFFRELTPEQLESIKVVTGDGAKWITDCVDEFIPKSERCIDAFHVVEWAMEAMEEVKREIWRELYAEAKDLKKDISADGDEKAKKDQVQKAKLIKDQADKIKGSKYALGKAPEHLTDNQKSHLEWIANESPVLYRAYQMKESIRLILKMDSIEEAEPLLKKWLWKASHSKIPAFVELSRKIRRHKKHIFNTIRLGFSNARLESTNNKIKLLIRKSYGFRNTDNMLDLIYLVCSDLVIPLPNRFQVTAKACA